MVAKPDGFGVDVTRGFHFNFRHLTALDTLCGRLNRLRRLTAVRTSASCDELCKQSLNCLAVFMLAKFAEEEGKKIDWTKLPKVAIYRGFAKAYIYFDTPEYIMKEMCADREIDKSVFEEAIQQKIRELAGDEFAEFICEGVSSYEERLYKAARKITNLVEFRENKFRMDNDDYAQKVQAILSDLKEMSDIPGVQEMSDMEGDLFKVLLKFASLRNLNRWAANYYTTECSVLGHLFETAVYAYAMALELEPNDQEKAAKMFFLGIYHDVAEGWTTDIPSPVKSIVIPGQSIKFRRVTEEYEAKMIELHLISKVPTFMRGAMEEVMFESPENLQLVPHIKGADYLSAVAECARQYVGGSNDVYFLEAMNRHILQMEDKTITVTPECRTMMYNWRDFAVRCTAHLVVKKA